MFTTLLVLPVFAVVFASAASYGRAMDELFGSPGTPRRDTPSAELALG